MNPVSPPFGPFSLNTEWTDVGSAADGSFVVVWLQNPATNVYGRIFESDGSPRTNMLQINSYETGSVLDPAVAVQPDGDFVVSWTSTQSPGTDSSENSIQARIFDSTGLPASDQVQVNTDTFSDQGESDVASTQDGSFVVVWRNDPNGGFADQTLRG